MNWDASNLYNEVVNHLNLLGKGRIEITLKDAATGELEWFFVPGEKTDDSWISVADRMPRVNAKVLLKDGHKQDEAYFIEWKEGYYFCIGQEPYQSWSPTHWKYID